MMSILQDAQLNQPERKSDLLQWFYEKHHAESRDYGEAKDDEKKVEYFKRKLDEWDIQVKRGLDLGCRAGTLTSQMQTHGQWSGVDIDANALELARKKGIDCVQSDFSIAIDFKDDSFDGVILTEVLEHLPYPLVTLKEVHRILEKSPNSVFMGSVPIDYHFHRRFAVLRGKRLTMDPTHLHSFSYSELNALLSHFFEEVDFAPMRGTKTRYDFLPWDHFVRDIAWVARGPKESPEEVTIKVFG